MPDDAPTPEQFVNYNRLPAWYVISIVLPGTAGAKRAGNVQLRPEPFVLHRITWATTGDLFRFFFSPYVPASGPQGRTVECRFGDAFTSFFGQLSGLVSAVFGDSEGFLDLPRGLVFQGSQPLEIELMRLFWPTSDNSQFPPQDTRWDFVFHGISLLPAGVNQSGSAG